MLTSSNTERRILKAMEQGAELVFHVCLIGTWNDGYTSVFKVTLERNGFALCLSEDRPFDGETFYRDDWDEAKLRNPYGRDYSGRVLADRLSKHADVREEYAGYRGDYDKTWRELYVHASTPVPLWVTEQWTFDG